MIKLVVGNNMSENPLELKVLDLFKTMSESSRMLLISMAHPSGFGVKKDGVAMTSGLESNQLDSALQNLQELGLLQTGKIIGQGKDQEFTVGEGNRFRLTPGVREQIFKDILKQEPPADLFDRG